MPCYTPQVHLNSKKVLILANYIESKTRQWT